MADSQDTEITLGAGRMLALFFALAAVCAVFFGLGYSAGKNSAKASADLVAASPAVAAHPVEAKPSANAPSQTTQKPPTASDAAGASAPPLPAAQAPPSSDNDAASPAADPVAPPIVGGYYVQVAAVREQGDAEALVEALKKKQYEAFSSAEPDKLFHVQIGPFAELKDAEANRAKLVSDGYSPILKK